jgi:hypothetical protein
VDLTPGEPQPLLIEFVKDLDVLVAVRPEGIYRIETSSLEVQPIAAPFDPLTPVGLVARMPKGERMGGPEEAQRARLEALTLAAAFLFGISEATLELALPYAKSREQFGRPIGSFQAIKHMLADMYVSATLARSNCYYGAWALSTNAAELPEAAASARISATQAFQHCAKNNIQVHGGMGFTWEFDCHMYYRRANALALGLGSMSYWEDALIDRLRKRNAA